MKANLLDMSTEDLEELQNQAYRERLRRMENGGAQCLSDPAPVAHLGKAVDMGSTAGQSRQPAGGMLTERLTLGNIDDAMHYQPWGPGQQEDGEQVREALTAAAKAILRNVPDGAFRAVALRNIIDARMNANAGISFRGRF